MISGFFDPTVSWPVPKVRAAVFLEGVSQRWAVVDFLLDTGAGTTMLSPRDSLVAVGINPVRLALPQYWSRREESLGIGGACTVYIVSAQYAFLHDDGEIQTLQGEVRVAQLRSDNQQLPSLLGWDVLQAFDLALHWAGRRITLQ